jgi:hypothetical protein
MVLLASFFCAELLFNNPGATYSTGPLARSVKFSQHTAALPRPCHGNEWVQAKGKTLLYS